MEFSICGRLLATAGQDSIVVCSNIMYSLHIIIIHVL